MCLRGVVGARPARSYEGVELFEVEAELCQSIETLLLGRMQHGKVCHGKCGCNLWLLWEWAKDVARVSREGDEELVRPVSWCGLARPWRCPVCSCGCEGARGRKEQCTTSCRAEVETCKRKKTR